MSITTKTMTQRSGDQSIRSAYNDANSTIAVDGFLTGVVGRKITQVISTTNVSNDTATFTFSENSINLYVIKVIYTDSSQATMLSAERTS